jgi:prepilin-type N-terminal cleavage/methylation domain-containing protein
MTRRRVPSGRGRAGGFTLIELLVVIAVIALLAAIIYPVFKSVKERALRTTCVSNFRQIAQALRNYAADSRRLLPPAPMVDTAHPGAPAHLRSSRPQAYQMWGLGTLLPYVQDPHLLLCRKAVEDPPTLLDPQTADPAELKQEKDLQMAYWQRLVGEGGQIKWAKASYHYRPDFYTSGDGIRQPGVIQADPDEPAILATLKDKIPGGSDPNVVQAFLNEVLLRWDRPIVYDYNHRSRGRAGVLYVNLDGAAAYDAPSLAVVESPWPVPP